MAEQFKNGEFGDWRGVQAKAKDTVVQVFSQILKFNWLEPYKTPEQMRAFGSGFFIDDEGYLVTNFHVVDEAVSVRIQIPSLGKQQFAADIVGVYPDMDIALLKLKEEEKARIEKLIGRIPYLALGNSDEVYRSQRILALGFPLGQEGLKSTQGIVSGKEKIRMLSYIQITAPLNPGSSGGPSLNYDGEVVGINFAGILSAQNVGYIIPINDVKYAINDLHKDKLLRRPYMGGIFSIANNDMVKYLGNPEDGGFYIAKVFKNASLEKAGVQEGDMIYEINNYRLDRYGEMFVPWSEDKISIFDLLNRHVVGDTINLVLYRNGERREVSFEFGRGAVFSIRFIFPKYEKIDYEVFGGMVLMNLSLNHVDIFCETTPSYFNFGRPENQQSPRLVVTNILLDSQAQRSRSLIPGDIISEVNGIKIGTLDEFRKAVEVSKKSRFFTLRTAGEIFAVLSIDKILADEDRFSERFFYKKSKLLDMFT